MGNFLDYDGLAYYHSRLGGIFAPKEEGKVMSSNDFTDEYKQKIDDLVYVPMAINSFTSNIGTAEMGSTVNEVVLNWNLVKEPVSQKVDATDVDKTLRTLTLTGQNITADKSYTLSATDERAKTVTKTTTIKFYNGVYYGVDTQSVSLDSALILRLTKVLQATKAKTFTVNAGAGQCIFFAIPTRYGTCNFNVGGFDGGFTKAGTIDFTNASGYTESYDVYKSDNAGLGSTTVKVS